MENTLRFYNFKKSINSELALSIRNEFNDVQIIFEDKKEKQIYRINISESTAQFKLRITVSQYDNCVSIVADEANIAIRAYQTLLKDFAA